MVNGCLLIPNIVNFIAISKLLSVAKIMLYISNRHDVKRHDISFFICNNRYMIFKITLSIS